MRQTVLANNIANANVPGFQRSDVNFHDALSQAMQTGSAGAIENVQFSAQTDSQTMRADGNGVDIDAEAAQMSQNGLEYESLVSVAKSRLDILKSAMGA